MQNTTERKDVYSRITAQIVEYLEKGVRPWVRPWNAEHTAGRITRPLRFNGKPYSGINILSLWMSAISQNFAAPIWMTYRQASEFNAYVRKGEKGSIVVYANAITRTEHDERTGEDVEHEIPYMKGYAVFNVEQIDGLPEVFYAKAVPTHDPVARIEHAEKFFDSLGAAIRHGGNRAYYAQELDYVQMPPFESFCDAESYYATLAHELTHWTKHEQRLNRDFGRKSWGDVGYASEELVAELGSAFLCADLELHQEAREDNAAYIANWLEVLKNDNRAIFVASAYAQRAADYLHQQAGRSLTRGDESPAGQPCQRPAHGIFTCQRSASGFKIDNMSRGYNDWIAEVNAALKSINMSMDDWQPRWPFDFGAEYKAGTTADYAAMKANRFWWLQQNKSLKQDCRVTSNCWLQNGHQGACQTAVEPRYRSGDYVKVEFPDETTGVGEWMWVRVTHCDEEKQLVFGTLDNQPLNDYDGKIELGSPLAICYSQIRDHKKATEFTKQ